MRAQPARRPLLPLAAAYASFGLLWGVWGAVFPEFVAGRSLSLGHAGNLLAALSVLSVVTMVFLPQHLEQVPRHVAVAAAVAINGLGIALLVVVPDGGLVLAFVVVGVGTGLTDVYVNVAGHELEVHTASAVLQRVHAAYSLGAAAGALGAGIGLTAGVPFGVLLLAVAALHLAAALVNLRRSGPERAAAVAAGPRPLTSLAVLVRVPLLLVPALVLASAFLIEGAIEVWAVLYLREALAASPLAGGLALAAFNLAAALGQLFAARVLFGLGYRATLISSGLAATVAGAVVVLAGSPLLAGVAFLAVGFALAATGPAAIGLVGRAGAEIGVAVAAVTTVGYASFVFGPPLLGWLAEHAGLRAAMSVIVVAALGIIVSAAADRPRASPLGRRREP